MGGYKCAFSAPLVAEAYHCACARPVTRRGGPDVDCVSADASGRCGQLFERLKSAALPAFGVEDDLLTMPHSVIQKIQYGGPLGLQRLLDREGAKVTDIDALVRDAAARYADLAELPCAELVGDITGFVLRARRRG